VNKVTIVNWYNMDENSHIKDDESDERRAMETPQDLAWIVRILKAEL
jgi:hypothetical protein